MLHWHFKNEMITEFQRMSSLECIIQFSRQNNLLYVCIYIYLYTDISVLCHCNHQLTKICKPQWLSNEINYHTIDIHRRIEWREIRLHIQHYSNSHTKKYNKMKYYISTTICSQNYAITLYQMTWHNKRTSTFTNYSKMIV
jgi:hypothetical protein